MAKEKVLQSGMKLKPVKKVTQLELSKIEPITKRLDVNVDEHLVNLRDLMLEDPEGFNKLKTVFSRPDLKIRVNRTRTPYGVGVTTNYGQVYLDNTFSRIEEVYISGARFDVLDDSIDGLLDLVGDKQSVLANLDMSNGQKRANRGRRLRQRKTTGIPYEEMQAVAFDDMSRAGLTYANFFEELGSMDRTKQFDLYDVMNELSANGVEEEDIAEFLIYESEYQKKLVAMFYSMGYEEEEETYEFEPVSVNDENAFYTRLLEKLNVEEAEYDYEKGALKIGERLITNLPNIDHNGVFMGTNGTRYLPYHIGYFENEGGTRVSRLRVLDPVEQALDGVALQYEATTGNAKFKTILDVTRNLIDFDTHPFGDEILDTLKRKIVLDKSYLKTNSFLRDYKGKADDLGSVAMMILDDDAEGLIDPYGTSNGANMGVIFYLTQDAQINKDGTLTHGQEKHSLVGDLMEEFAIDTDNFNRHQMSFNALLTSEEVRYMNTTYAEFALWNSDDAIVLTKRGAEQFSTEMQTGDKVIDFHGNKSVSSLIVDPDMSDEEAEARGILEAVKFVRLNPELDMIVSPVSINSRLNMGVVKEGLASDKHDLTLLDGTVVKDGIVQMAYMQLPQTAEHKSKDYGVEGKGRRYSTLFRYALASKVGGDLYKKAFISDEVRGKHIDEVSTAFTRLGVTFEDEAKLIKSKNVNGFVDAPITLDMEDFEMKKPSTVRMSLMNQMVDNKINIDLGDMAIVSPLTGQPIVDSEGRNVLPIRVTENTVIPYRYMDVFSELASGNADGLQRAYARACAPDYRQLTRKDNLLKNIDTMIFKEGAATSMIIPDPTIKLGQIRTADPADRVVAHRDPAIQSGNTISFENVGGNMPNVTHVNPLMIVQVDGDFDSDTMGINSFDNLGLTEEEKDEFFNRSSVYEQLNYYGEVFLVTNGSHFKAVTLASGIDTSDITFEDGKSNAELAEIVEAKTEEILKSPKAYGAYALSFADEQTIKDSLGKIADDGIKGNRQDVVDVFDNGYTLEEDREVLRSLLAKSEMTGVAGAITNNVISNLDENKFDDELVRVALDVTHSQTQSVLQMKRDASKLGMIYDNIIEMKKIMAGKKNATEARESLKIITQDFLPNAGCDKFVDVVSDRQEKAKQVRLERGWEPQKGSFGTDVLSGTSMSTAKMAYATEDQFKKVIKRLANVEQDKGGAELEL